MIREAKILFNKYRQLIPVLLMLFLMEQTFANSYEVNYMFGKETGAYLLSWKNYVALALILLCLGVFFFFRKYYKYILFATLIAGLFNLISFTYYDSFSYTSVNDRQVLRFQPVTFFIIIITYLTNRSSANRHILQFIKDLRG